MLILDKSSGLKKADFIRIADAAGFTPSGDFTLEFFDVKFVTTTGTQTLYSHYLASGNLRSLLFDWVSGTGLRVILSLNGTATTTVSYSWTPTVGVAYQLCVERSGSTVRLYVNGVVGNSGTLAGALFNSPDAVYLGCSNTGSPPNTIFSGTAKAMRFTVGVARYAGAYTPPSLPLPTS